MPLVNFSDFQAFFGRRDDFALKTLLPAYRFDRIFRFSLKIGNFLKKIGKTEIEMFQHSIFESKFAFKPFDDRSSFFACASPRFCCHFLPSDQFGANPCKNGPKKCAPIHWKTRFFKPFDDLLSVFVCSAHRFCYNFFPSGDFRANSRKRPQKICANSSENQVF